MMVSGAKKGEVTAYLSLIFILFISFVGGIMESASVQMAKNYRRADMNRAMESVFAEYQKELLDEYEIFALEATYETGTYGERNIKKRLEFYGAEGMEQSVKRLSLLTDHGGQPFLEQVAVYMEEKYGMDKVKDLTGKSADWKTQEEEAGKYEENEKKQQGELDQLLEENEGELPEKDNPIAHVAGLKKSSLPELVMPKGKKVSDKQMNLADTLEYRGKREGYGDFSDVSEGIGKLDHLLLGEYLMEHFSDNREFDLYRDINTRTNGEIYIGVVGPVRTGKSTFIKRFMETLVLPGMADGAEKQRTIDELPQSGSGKTITTTEPKFIPDEAVSIRTGDASFQVKMVDCVGYLIPEVLGTDENGETIRSSAPT